MVGPEPSHPPRHRPADDVSGRQVATARPAPRCRYSPSRSRNRAPAPRNASEASGRGSRPRSIPVGWNCTNSRSATCAPARMAAANPSPLHARGLVVQAQSWPYPPRGQDHRAGPEVAQRPAARVPDQRAGHPGPVGRRSRGRPGTGPASPAPPAVTPASSRARVISAPVASPRACTTRAKPCPPSLAKALPVEAHPEVGQQFHSSLRRLRRSPTAPPAGHRGRRPPRPCRPHERPLLSPGPIGAAMPPWASWVLPPPPALLGDDGDAAPAGQGHGHWTSRRSRNRLPGHRARDRGRQHFTHLRRANRSRSFSRQPDGRARRCASSTSMTWTPSREGNRAGVGAWSSS